ncbi:hypothetical protein Ocin01_03715 [Orchesella cincta]|uniref:Uncharacterized protein n=1 Tax=Orchesella cincta TaxID=48709 RepID=A0A1D2NCG7_ORCCI|nr:hypothetical protein Ocin01_03715 [Orchesella cincta]
MACISGKVKHACCSVCLFIVVLALEQHTIPSVLAQDETSRIPMELMSWGSESPKTELQVGEPSTSTPSLVVLLVNDVPWTDSSLGRQNGRFTVRAPRGHGLMAVIQILNLRSETDNVGSLVCKDYLKFSDGVTGVSTPNICGELKKENKSFIPENLIGPRVFHSPSGKIEIVYDSDKGEDADSGERPATSSQQQSRHVVEIVFTAYSECLLDTFGDQIKCGDKCISHVLNCDQHFNCAFPETFAIDEDNCAYQGLAASGRENTVGSGRPPYLVTLYLAAFLFVCIIIAIAFYHRHTTYQRIKNIPT